jgi:uncharacterized protein
MTFEWDSAKDRANQAKHHVGFQIAREVFRDSRRVIQRDDKHSTAAEERFFCYGEVDGMILTVRFTMRKDVIRIFGAAYWRQGVDVYGQARGTDEKSS